MYSIKNQLKIGIVLNYINMFIGTIIPVLYTPIMLSILGQNEYGLYKLSSSITSYLGLISMGLGSAVSRYLIKAQTEKGKEEEEKMLGLFMIIFQIIAVASLIVGIFMTMNLEIWYGNSLSVEELEKMKIIVLLLVCNTALNFQMTPYISIATTHERFIFVQIMNIISTSVAPIINLVVLFLGYASVGMAISTLALGVFSRFIYVWYVKKRIGIRAKYKDIPVYLLKEIVGFSFWVFVANVVNQLHSATDTVMIGLVPTLATAGVAVYNVGATFNSLTLTLTTGVSSLLSTKTNKLVFSGASNIQLVELAAKVGRIQAYIVTLIVSGFVVFGRQFIFFYAGSDYADAYWVAVFMMIPAMVPLVQSICLNIIIAQNKHKFRSIVCLVTAILNVIGTWFAMKYMGVIGAAFMTGLTSLVGTTLIMNIYYAKKIELDIKYFWKNVGKVFVVPLVMVIVFLFISKWIDFYNLLIMAIGIIIYTILYCLLNWFFTMNEYEKNLFCVPIKKVFCRIRRI